MTMMISKEQYVALYCDISLYLSAGVMAVSKEKVSLRMKLDPIQTLQDLHDYGIDEPDIGVSLLGDGGLTPLNKRGAKTFSDFEKMLFSDEEPSWGSEDSIE